MKNAASALVRILGLTLIGGTLSFTANAQSDCKVNDPDIAGSYSGECRNGLANGQGTASGKDKYVGEFRDGLEHGKGDYTWGSGGPWGSGGHYVGDWVNGKKTGKGVLTWLNSQLNGSYEGDFVNGDMTWKGIYTWANGNRYEGDVVKGVLSGKGTFTWASGNRYIGDWVNGKKTGKGVVIFANGSRYEGGYKDNERDGFGILRMTKDVPDIESYENSSTARGKWIGDIYLVQGLFKKTDAGSEFILSCPSEAACEKQKRIEEARKAREENERYAHACDNYYPGRVGKVKGDGIFATDDGFIVRYVNKERKMVTIEGTTGGNSFKYGATEEFSCNFLQQHER